MGETGKFLLRAAWVAAVVLTLAGCDSFQRAILKRNVDNVVAGDRTDWLSDDALHVILCGTGAPLPDPNRAGPCTAIIAGGQMLLVDTGPGSWENVQIWRLPRVHTRAILLTHFHSDHIGELGEAITQLWIAGKSEPLEVYGPKGVEQVVEGFQQAYAFDRDYRVAHHTEEFMPRPGGEARGRAIAIEEGGASAPVFSDGKLRVTAFRVDHAPVEPAYGYRIEYGDRAVFVSGDTVAAESVVEGADGVDVLVHEALAAHIIGPASELMAQAGARRLAKMGADVLDYHTTPLQAAEIAEKAGAGTLVLTHIVPSPPNFFAERYFMRNVNARSWPGDVILGYDGLHLRLPLDSDSVERENLGG